MTARIVPAPRSDAPSPGQRLAAYRRIALAIPATGNLDPALDRVVRLLPDRCPWLLAAAARRLTADGQLALVTSTAPARFPSSVPVGEPIAGWAADRGDALVIVDRPAFRGLGPAGGSAAAAPIARLNGAVIGTLEVVAADPWGVLDGDGQGLRQLGQALSRPAPADHPELRPAARPRSLVRPLIDTCLAAAGPFATQLLEGDPPRPTGGDPPAGREMLLRVACREAEAVTALTECLTGLWEDRGPDADSLDAACLAAHAALDPSAARSLYRQVHRELRRVLAQCTDADLVREPRIEAWVETVTRQYRAGVGRWSMEDGP